MKAAGPINRPEVAPFDFSKPAFPDISRWRASASSRGTR